MVIFNKPIFLLTTLLILLVFSHVTNATEITALSQKQINGHPYQILSSSKIKSTGIRLIGSGRGIKRINALLQKDFADQMEAELGCINEEKGWGDTSKKSLIEWNNGYIVVKTDSIEECGGVHANYGSSVDVFNLKTGEIENTRFWIKEDYQNEIDPSLMHSEVLEYSDLIIKHKRKLSQAIFKRK